MVKVYVYGDSKNEILDVMEFENIMKCVSWRGTSFRVSNTIVTKDPLCFITNEPDELLMTGTFYFYYDN